MALHGMGQGVGAVTGGRLAWQLEYGRLMPRVHAKAKKANISGLLIPVDDDAAEQR